MRTPSISSVQYMPGQVPEAPAQLREYLEAELGRIASAIGLLAAGHIDRTYAVPAKPRDGDIRYADGAAWNPGSGEGIYFFNGVVWKPLG